MGVERLWEKSYPPGVRWDAPIEMATLPALFDTFTKRWAEKPALDYRDRKTSYAELRTGVEAFASGLMDLGVGPGTAVALYLPNSPYRSYSSDCQWSLAIVAAQPIVPGRVVPPV